MLKILVVDDSLIMRKNLTKLLTSLGHEVVYAAKNGVEAIEAYKAKQPDLVTMDITMPDMDGIDAVKAILAEDREAKIIMVTSHAEEHMLITSMFIGARGYIIKPFKKHEVCERIATVFPDYPCDDLDDEMELSEEDL